MVGDLLQGEDQVEPVKCSLQLDAGTHDEDLILCEPLIGNLTLIPIDQAQLLAQVAAKTALELTCDRCLNEYTLPVTLAYQQLYSTGRNQPDTFPISGDATIDPKPSLLQEIRLSLPLKAICRTDCPGITLSPHS